MSTLDQTGPNPIDGSDNGIGIGDAKPTAAEAATNAEADLDQQAPPAAAMFAEVRGQLLARAKGDEKPVPLKWPALADVLGGGLWPGLHVLVGGTGTGKTQWALQTAVHAALQGVPSLYIGLELGKLGVAARLASLLDDGGSVHWSDIYKGECSAKESQRILDNAEQRLTDLPLRVEFGDSYGWNYLTMKARLVAMTKRYEAELAGPPKRPPLVILDFLQVVGTPMDSAGSPLPGFERQDLRQRIQQACYHARMVAREFDAAVLLLSGTSRNNYGRLTVGGEGGPRLADIETVANPDDFIGMGKESGEIEYGADSLIALLREKRAPKDAPTCPGGQPIHFVVAKVRAGVPAHAELRFDGTRFVQPVEVPWSLTADDLARGGKELREELAWVKWRETFSGKDGGDKAAPSSRARPLTAEEIM